MPPLCNYCGKPVWDRYIVAEGQTWHPEHFLCASCGRPIQEASYQTSEGQRYHQACFRERVLPRCVYCQKPLEGRYALDGWGNAFCEIHRKQFPACSFCHRLIPPREQTPGWQAYGSRRCTVCRATAIETSEQARPAYDRLKVWLGQQGFRFQQLPLRLELWERARIDKAVSTHTINHTLGITLSRQEILNQRVLSTKVEGIAVVPGMPATLFAGVVAHELGHAWLIVHEIRSLPLPMEEGFCQLLSYRYYQSLSTPEARYHSTALAKDTDPVYGDGFRQVLALSERVGFDRLVEYLQKNKRLPT
jgi:hypothetical protein